jgi:hypothetical protein
MGKCADCKFAIEIDRGYYYEYKCKADIDEVMDCDGIGCSDFEEDEY